MCKDSNSIEVLGVKFSGLSFQEHLSNVETLISDAKGGIVCVANVHMTVEAQSSPNLADAIEKAAYVVPDGMPLVWLARQNTPLAERVAGYDLMLALCSLAQARGWQIGFYGSTQQTLGKVVVALHTKFPGLKTPLCISPPFRALDAFEEDQHVCLMNEKKVDIVFVALGCPKQEIWMHKVSPRVRSVLIGVGGALPLLAGEQPRAPQLVRQMGLEWLYRLYLEPRRLWRRYAYTNTAFICLLARSWLAKIFRKDQAEL